MIQAQGREERGSGAAGATITAVMVAREKTRVDLSTEMAISGRAAQFGRSLLDEVGASLIREFAQRLEASITRDGDDVSALPSGSEGDSLDVGRTVLLPLLRRAVRPAVTAVLGILLGWAIGRRTARQRGPVL